MASRLRPQHYAAGEKIIEEGAAGDSLFLVDRGEVRVLRRLGGTPREIARLGEGECFGEMAMLTGQQRTATVVASTDVDVFMIDKAGFQDILAGNPDMAVDISGSWQAPRRVHDAEGTSPPGSARGGSEDGDLSQKILDRIAATSAVKRGRCDRLFAALMAAGEDGGRVREALDAGRATASCSPPSCAGGPLALPRAPATTPPWSEDQRLLGSVVLSPACRADGPGLVGSLFWRDLADVAASPRVAAAARVRAEALLLDHMGDLRLGDRITLAKIATPPVLAQLLEDGDPRVVEAGLINGRLREEDLAGALRKDTVTQALIEGIAASSRWRDRYSLRLAIVLQPRSPLAVALAQVTALLPRDLERVAADEGLAPLVQMAARRVATGK